MANPKISAKLVTRGLKAAAGSKRMRAKKREEGPDEVRKDHYQEHAYPHHQADLPPTAIQAHHARAHAQSDPEGCTDNTSLV